MTSADILLLLILAGAFLIGFFWGVIRGLLALAAELVVFLLSAHLASPFAEWLGQQWTNFSADYVHMLAWLILFAFLFTLSLVLVQLGVRTGRDLSRWPLL